MVTPTELSVAEICIQNQMSVADLCKLFEDDTFTAYLHRLIEGYSSGAVGTVCFASLATAVAAMSTICSPSGSVMYSAPSVSSM